MYCIVSIGSVHLCECEFGHLYSTSCVVQYTFGEGYNCQSPSSKRQGVGGDMREKLYPRGKVDEIPKWLKALVIEPLEDAGLLKEEWVNCVVINDYYNGTTLFIVIKTTVCFGDNKTHVAGGCDEPRIEPPQLFDRPLLSISFFDNAFIAFGTRVRS